MNFEELVELLKGRTKQLEQRQHDVGGQLGPDSNLYVRAGKRQRRELSQKTGDAEGHKVSLNLTIWIVEIVLDFCLREW